jgi:hypothetical protein
VSFTEDAPDAPDIAPLVGLIEGLRRRARWMVAARAGLYGVAGLLGLWSVAMALAGGGVGRAEARLGLGLSALTLLGLGLTALVWAWRRASDEGGQITAVEVARPALRGRLSTVMERRGVALEGESPLILALASRRAAVAVAGMQAEELYPRRALRPGLALALMMGAVFAITAARSAMGPIETFAWLGGQAAPAPTEQALAPVAEATTLIGDMVLRYEYPAYTGLPPLEVPNSNGEAHGPPGTRVTVRARTAEVFDDASLQAYEAAPERSELVSGRDVSGSFAIAGEGAYRFFFNRGAERQRSPDFTITADPDLPPTVTVEAAADRMEVSWDQVIPLSWEARDDYGLARVLVRVGRGEKELRSLLIPQQVLGEPLGLTPDKLGLKAGDEVTLHIVAYDNDEISGSKAGESRGVRIVVLGPKGEARRQLKIWKDLRDALVDVLAGFIVDPSPIAKDRQGIARWAGQSSGRFEPMEQLLDQYWDGFDARTMEGRMVEELRRLGAALLRFAQEIGDPRNTLQLSEADLTTLAELHDELVGQLEINILMLDRIVRYRAIQTLYGLAETMTAQGADLAARAEAGAAAGELLTRLGQLDEVSEKLQNTAKEYDGGALSELVNDWMADIGRASDRTRQLIAAGDDAGAQQMALLLADQIARFAATLESMQRKMDETTEEDEQKIKEFIEELERIEAAERALLAETQAARKADGSGGDDLTSLWAEADRLAARLETLTREADSAVMLNAEERFDAEISRSERLIRQASRAARAVGARDAVTARQESQRAMLGALDLHGTISAAKGWRGESGLSGDAAASKALNEAANVAQELVELLSGADERNNRASPALAQKLQRQAPTQETLRDDVLEVTPFARELAEQLPMGAPGLVESLEGADREMRRADLALDRARVVEAEGAEEAAADRVRQAIEALSQAGAAMGEMSAAMQQEGGQGGREGEEDAESADGPDGDDPGGRIELPNPEEFRTPDEYRKALLEGMQATVPEEYEAQKRRYYEELVRQ